VEYQKNFFHEMRERMPGQSGDYNPTDSGVSQGGNQTAGEKDRLEKEETDFDPMVTYREQTATRYARIERMINHWPLFIWT
jgi:hypothetical protein